MAETKLHQHLDLIDSLLQHTCSDLAFFLIGVSSFFVHHDVGVWFLQRLVSQSFYNIYKLRDGLDYDFLGISGKGKGRE